MSKRKYYSAEGKVGIIRDYLENGIAVGQLCEKYNLHPNIVYICNIEGHRFAGS